MFATQALNVLVVALSTFAAAQAILIDPVFRTHVAQDVVKRQKTGEPTGQATNTSPTTSPIPTTSPPLTASTVPTSSSVIITPTSSKPEPSQTPSNTPSPTPTPTPSPSLSSTPPPPETKSSTSSSTESVKTTFSTVTSIVTSTRPDGVQTTYTTEQVSTSTPDLASAQSSGQTGMSSQTRNTVIGVVVGVGGAIVLAAIAFLAFRLYRKKQPEEGDGLMEYNNSGYAAAEKSDAGSSASQSGRSPFQSTLESYHAPTQVNTASNF